MSKFRLLVVEDDAVLAMGLEMTLTQFGFEVVDLASRLEEAIRLASGASFDGAILDVNLGGVKVFPVADILAARNIPFLFTTGYGSSGLRECDLNRPVLQKPYHPQQLAAVIWQWSEAGAN